MSITEYKNTKGLVEYHEVKIGKLFFFERFVISEFNEGVHINFESFKETKEAIINFFGNKDFGVVTNRTNTYSLDLNDANNFNDSFPNLKAYAVVINTLFGRGIFEVENQFFNYNREIFKTLENAISWVEETLENN